MKGIATLPIIIGVIIVLMLAGGGYFLNKKQSTSDDRSFTFIYASPSPLSSISPVPTAKLSSTSKPTPSATIKPTNTPSPSPSPSVSPTPEPEKTGCAAYNSGGDLGILKVTITPQEGEQLVGDTGVTIDSKFDCPGIDPGFPLTKVISQGSTQTEFSGMRPGPFKIEVLYHGKTSNHDIQINSGENSITVTVSD